MQDYQSKTGTMRNSQKHRLDHETWSMTDWEDRGNIETMVTTHDTRNMGGTETKPKS